MLLTGVFFSYLQTIKRRAASVRSCHDLRIHRCLLLSLAEFGGISAERNFSNDAHIGLGDGSYRNPLSADVSRALQVVGDALLCDNGSWAQLSRSRHCKFLEKY